MDTIALRPGPVTLYAQLASILRDRIVSGVWKTGDSVPTLKDLGEEFSVARVTVRQAMQMLVRDGLLSSQRGRRTTVAFEPPKLSLEPLYSSTGSINHGSSNYSIQVLSVQEFEGLPPYLAISGVAAAKYMRIRKVDSENGVPYVVSDNFVLLSLYKRFPARAEHKAKLSRLVRDYAKPALVSGSEQITVDSLSYEEANLLQAPIGNPVARVTRVFLAPAQQIVYAGRLAYRADRFAIGRDISSLLAISDKSPGDYKAETRSRRMRAPRA